MGPGSNDVDRGRAGQNEARAGHAARGERVSAATIRTRVRPDALRTGVRSNARSIGGLEHTFDRGRARRTFVRPGGRRRAGAREGVPAPIRRYIYFSKFGAHIRPIFYFSKFGHIYMRARACVHVMRENAFHPSVRLYNDLVTVSANVCTSDVASTKKEIGRFPGRGFHAAPCPSVPSRLKGPLLIITGITTKQFTDIIAKLNVGGYEDNLRPLIGREFSANRFSARVVVNDSGAREFGPPKAGQVALSAPGARKSAHGRRIPAACWHAYRDVLAAIFDVNPKAAVRTALSTYLDREHFYHQYPATAHRNIGSMMSPAYMPELCDCAHWGISTHEQG